MRVVIKYIICAIFLIGAVAACMYIMPRPLVSQEDLAILARNDTLSRFYMPIRHISSLPGFHWYGANGNDQFDSRSNYILGVKTVFDFRDVGPYDEIEVGVYEVNNNFRWRKLGVSHAWDRSSGCNLRFESSSPSLISWTDLHKGQPQRVLFDLNKGHVISRDNLQQPADPRRSDVAICSSSVIYPNEPEWVVHTDFPNDSTGHQSLYLENARDKRRFPIADLYIPAQYRGRWSCAIYPRFMPDGKHFVFDAPNFNGRQMYIVKIEIP